MTTKIETEAKIELSEEEFSKLSGLLLGLNEDRFMHGLPEPQENIFYRSGDKIVRVRDQTFLDPWRGENSRGVYMNAKFPASVNSKYKAMVEPEIQISSNYEKIESFLEAIGFQKFFSYKKQRANYKISQCVVSQDFIPEYKKYFIEVEGEEKNIGSVLEKLNLQDKPLEKRSYLEILMGEKNGVH